MKTKAIFLSLLTALFLGAPALASGSKGADHKGKTTLTGCLSERDGGFVLTNKEYPDGVKLATTKHLEEHLGHEVQVSGSWATLPNAGTESAGAEKKDEIKVTSFKHISKTCDMSPAPAPGSKY